MKRRSKSANLYVLYYENLLKTVNPVKYWYERSKEFIEELGYKIDFIGVEG